ncbi:MAG TPA: hypothetical protein VD886_20675 [Herpetosiphonaceae bacterium]|nr:hypothetical protein [Herpetosiphonaceae bacterium]
MSFFKTQLGERPLDDAAKPGPASQPAGFGATPGERPQDDAAKPVPAHVPQPAPAAFGAALGDRPASDPPPASSQGAPATQEVPAPPCPLCRGELLADAGLWRCMGTCGARWLADGMGRLIDLAALPYGICACCAAPQALVRSDIGHAACPRTGRIHLLAGGRPLLADRLPGGACSCCAPPQPLVSLGAAVVCPAHPEREYAQVGGVWRLQAAPPSVDATLSAIDAALRANSAKVTIYGLFDVD